jgi:hypothetical protein
MAERRLPHCHDVGARRARRLHFKGQRDEFPVYGVAPLRIAEGQHVIDAQALHALISAVRGKRGGLRLRPTLKRAHRTHQRRPDRDPTAGFEKAAARHGCG